MHGTVFYDVIRRIVAVAICRNRFRGNQGFRERHFAKRQISGKYQHEASKTYTTDEKLTLNRHG